MIHSTAPRTLPNWSTGPSRSGHIRRAGLLRHVAFLNIRSQLHGSEILFVCFFFVMSIYREIIGRILKPLVLEFRPDLMARLKDTAERQVPAKLKPIVVLFIHSLLKLGRRHICKPGCFRENPTILLVRG